MDDEVVALSLRLSESEFMQYSEVENHDDFYSFTGEGGVRVWDGRGVGIMYDVALEDLRRLEQELLVVGSHYIQQEGGERGKVGQDSEHCRGNCLLGSTSAYCL